MMMRSQTFCVCVFALVVSCCALPTSLDEKDYVEPEITPENLDSENNHTAIMEEVYKLSRSHLEKNHPHLIEQKKKREISDAGGRRRARQASPLFQNDRRPDMRILEPLTEFNSVVNETASSFVPLAVERKRRASRAEKKRIPSEGVEDDVSVSVTEVGLAEPTEASANDENSTLSLESSEDQNSEIEPSEITGGNTSLPENFAKSEDESDAKVQTENGKTAEAIGVAVSFRDMETLFGEGENPLEDEVFLVERIRRDIEEEHLCPKDEEGTKARNQKLAEKAKEE